MTLFCIFDTFISDSVELVDLLSGPGVTVRQMAHAWDAGHAANQVFFLNLFSYFLLVLNCSDFVWIFDWILDSR